MGKPDVWDHVAQCMIVIAALFCGINGAFMTVNPAGWFALVETAHHTGEGNLHVNKH
ncbi:MAG: hypothetical protein GYA66_11705 [Phyllobacteriaceae bacterium]|nr:hypothetical protein [Phyllobacteriaceae bacterium]